MKKEKLQISLVLLLIVGSAGCNRTENDWKQAKESNTVPGYADFITKHPQAAHIDEARTAIESLDWNSAKESNSVPGYTAFIASHPQAAHAEEARTAIESLDWNSAKESNTVPGYTAFIASHPQAAHAEEARTAIESLDWNSAKESNTVPGYTAFIASHPQAAHVEEARTAIETLDWNLAIGQDTTDAYNAYVTKYPQGRYVSEAKAASDWLDTIKNGTPESYIVFHKYHPNSPKLTVRAGAIKWGHGMHRDPNPPFGYVLDSVTIGDFSVSVSIQEAATLGVIKLRQNDNGSVSVVMEGVNPPLDATVLFKDGKVVACQSKLREP
jgi:hypothetical protein